MFLPRTGYVVNEYRISGQHIQDIQLVDADYIPPAPPEALGIPSAPPFQPPVQVAPAVVPPVPHIPSYQQPSQLYPQYGQYGQPTRAPIAFQIPQRVAPHSYNHVPPPRYDSPKPPPTHAAPKKQPAPFEDPAILSMGRKPSTALTPMTVPPPPQPPTPQPEQTPTRQSRAASSSTAAIQRPASGLQRNPSSQSTAAIQRPTSGLQRKSSSQGTAAIINKLSIPASTNSQHPLSANAAVTGSVRVAQREPGPSSVVTAVQQSFADMKIRKQPVVESDAFDETDDAQSAVRPAYDNTKFTGKRSRRGRSHMKKHLPQQQFVEPTVPEEAPKNRVIQPGMFAGPIAEAAVGKTRTRGAGSTARKSARRSRKNRDDQNRTEEDGWATEDVTDFKTHEFDFQSNLDRFDKKTVFSQIKAGDTTADEERLVSFNRLPQKAPAKKNYNHNENVLGTYANGNKALAERDGWQSPQFLVDAESSDSEEEVLRGRGSGNLDSGRNSRHAMTRRSLSHRRGNVRQMSTNAAARLSMENLITQSSSACGSGAPTVASKSPRPHLRISSSNRPCPVVSPLQMIDVEGIAENELGLTDDMMTENAGRGIAQVAIQAFGKRISATNHNALPVVLVFAGNNKSGARAIAAGRHLKNHHVRVMVCVLGLEREEELLGSVHRQLNIFRNAGGRVARWEELQPNLRSLDAPPELIIDGLLGTHIAFGDLRTDDQATAFKLVQFANKSKASVLSVDIPSGIDGQKGAPYSFPRHSGSSLLTHTGEVARIDDTDAFCMRAKWVVCMGAPKSGLLRALENGIGDNWSLYVADIGISNTAWRKYGSRRRHGVEFAMEWVCQLFYSAERFADDR